MSQTLQLRHAPNRSVLRIVSWFIVLVAFAGLVRHTQRARTSNLFGVDYRFFYASSNCLITDCNPYSSSETQARFLRQGASEAEIGSVPSDGPFRPYNSGYPPTAYLLLSPLALLRWHLSFAIWMVSSILGFLLATALVLRLADDYAVLPAAICLSVFIYRSDYVLILGQPTLWVVSLITIAVFLLIRGSWQWLAITCFSLALAFKPQLGGFIWLYLAFAPRYRRAAWKILAATCAFSLLAVAVATAKPASRHWLQDMRANIAGISAHGHPSDPGPANVEAEHMADLRSMVAVFVDKPSVYNKVVLATAAAFLLAIWYFGRRMPEGREKDLILIATLASVTLIPVYHREYDARLLLVTFPALGVMLACDRFAGYLGWLCTLAACFLTSEDYYFSRAAFKPLQRILRLHIGSKLEVALLERPAVIATLLMSVFYAGYLIRASSRGLPDAAHKE
jgi:hypothetical protein